MKSSIALTALTFASIALSSPTEKRQGQTSFTLCKDPECLGNQQITIDVQYGTCRNFAGIPGAWDNAARGVIPNGGDVCLLHDGSCSDQGTTIRITNRTDLTTRNFDRIASSVTCFREADAPPAEKQKRQVDTTITLCKETRCTGPADQQTSADLAFGRCFDFPSNFDNQVIALKTNTNAACSLHQGPCAAPGVSVDVQGQVDDLTQPPYNSVGTSGSSITCQRRA